MFGRGVELWSTLEQPGGVDLGDAVHVLHVGEDEGVVEEVVEARFSVEGGGGVDVDGGVFREGVEGVVWGSFGAVFEEAGEEGLEDSGGRR